MPGPFKTRKQLEKEYSFKKPRVFSNLGKNKLADAIRVITGKAPFKKKAKGGIVKMNMGGVIPGRGGSFKGIK